ncbi:aminotransferase class I/II-fold pyridoxal phosphate-dependent enzyme, partial [Clostridium sp.]|uniref:aminotransferase class I/II-fold pyridoxal phosphate-dependent enzyme n=1 Tax=Clostridium sp. TaxID=1506 RepID=UPI002628534D
KDKTVGVVTPHFYRISETIQKLVLINGEFSVNSMFVDVEYIEKYIQNYSIDAIWISNPNSIVGFGYEKESLKYLINKYPNVLFIFDETNIEFYSECDELTMISELEKNLNTVVIRSCSKFFGVPGARIGVISTYNEDIMKSYVKMNPTFPVSGSSIQFAALAFKNYSLFRNLAKDINDTKRILKKMFQ